MSLSFNLYQSFIQRLHNLCFREQLQKFFFPLDYQEQIVSKAIAPGQRREHSGLDIRFDFDCDSTVDILFTKDQVKFHGDTVSVVRVTVHACMEMVLRLEYKDGEMMSNT